MRDVVIVGGGPAGLASAVALREVGMDVVLLERAREPVDKACGEGILPRGVAWLKEHRVRSLLTPDESTRLTGIAYSNEDGIRAYAPLPAPGGLGVRRTVLERALLTRAQLLGVEVRHSLATGYTIDGGGVLVEHAGGTVRAGMLVAADGLHSGLRAAAGLGAPRTHRRRFGLRRHFGCLPWSDAVEVHFARGAEAYVTPIGARAVNVALLFEAWRSYGARNFDELLSSFPALAARLAGAEPVSPPRGAGPFFADVRGRVADRLALVGDAAGYVDAITGDGLSVAFSCASALADVAPHALTGGASRAALSEYDRRARSSFRTYAFWAQLMCQLVERPWLRQLAVGTLARHPHLFAGLIWLATRPTSSGVAPRSQVRSPFPISALARDQRRPTKPDGRADARST
jgi:flavin-dependent dehydrogenase